MPGISGSVTGPDPKQTRAALPRNSSQSWGLHRCSSPRPDHAKGLDGPWGWSREQRRNGPRPGVFMVSDRPLACRSPKTVLALEHAAMAN